MKINKNIFIFLHKEIKDFFPNLMKRPVCTLLRLLTALSAVLTFAVLIFIISHILIRGIPYIRPSLFALRYTSENVSLFPALITTVMVVGSALVLAVPIGVFTAIYLVEYAQRGNKIVNVIRLMAETLSGIPSIVYGLFGYLFFVVFLGWGYSLIAGSCTVAIMILPLIIRTTEESLKSVPDSFREAAFGLGAGKLRTVVRIVLPSAVPSILAGIILATGRIVGESAALMFTLGNTAIMTTGLFSSGRTMALHMYSLATEGFNVNQAYATAVVLIIVVAGINTLSWMIASKIAKK
jgi:phosphate transport system permease protein